MPDLQFHIEGSEAVAHAAAPMLALKLRITSKPPTEAIHSLSLRCQVQIEPTRRRYGSTEQEMLRDLFGEPDRWSRSVRSMLWMNTNITVPGFSESTLVDLELPCTFDFNVASTKYFHALQSGEIPLCILYSGTAFYQTEDGTLQVAHIPWDRETNYRLPAAIWHQMMDEHYPNSTWLRIDRETFDRLYRYKVRHGILSWEKLLDALIPSEDSREEEERLPA
jgi:hypothetical protein